MKLLLVRHGQTPANVKGVLDTAIPGPSLTALGDEQAAAVPSGLADHSIDALYVSQLVRTHRTAAPLASALGMTPAQLDGTHEIAAGDLELRSDRDAIRTYMTTAFSWGAGDLSIRMPGGETGHQFFSRFDDSISQVWDEVGDGTAVVVSHGAAIRVWVAQRAINVPPTFAGDREIDNTGVVVLEGSPDDGWILRSWQGEPVGGGDLSDQLADDPTGESVEDAIR